MVTWTISIQFLGFHAVRCFNLLLRSRMFPRFPLFIFQTSTFHQLSGERKPLFSSQVSWPSFQDLHWLFQWNIASQSAPNDATVFGFLPQVATLKAEHAPGVTRTWRMDPRTQPQNNLKSRDHCIQSRIDHDLKPPPHATHCGWSWVHRPTRLASATLPTGQRTWQRNGDPTWSGGTGVRIGEVLVCQFM